MSAGLAVGLMIVCFLVGLGLGFVFAVVGMRDAVRYGLDLSVPITIRGDPKAVKAAAAEVAAEVRKQSMAQKGGPF